MANFFRHLPITAYSFGDNENSVIFNDLTAYVDIIDQLRGNIEFYQTIEIVDGDRPDTLSQKLYGTTEYHWTFFFLNDSIRISGWPIVETDIISYTAAKYPNRVVTTEESMANILAPGDHVVGKNSGTSGTVIYRNPSMGQIFIKPNSTNKFKDGEQIAGGLTAQEQNESTITIIKDSTQSNAPMYWKDTNGEIVDIDPYDQSNTGALIPLTFLDHEMDYNNSLKTIKIIKPSAVSSVASEFRRLMKQ
jgi:hypothetical protein